MITIIVTLTWALINLSRHPEKQHRLRTELAEFPGKNPSYDQLAHGFPYLDAIVREVLRLHPPVEETERIVIPLVMGSHQHPSLTSDPLGQV